MQTLYVVQREVYELGLSCKICHDYGQKNRVYSANFSYDVGEKAAKTRYDKTF